MTLWLSRDPAITMAAMDITRNAEAVVRVRAPTLTRESNLFLKLHILFIPAIVNRTHLLESVSLCFLPLHMLFSWDSDGFICIDYLIVHAAFSKEKFLILSFFLRL